MGRVRVNLGNHINPTTFENVEKVVFGNNFVRIMYLEYGSSPSNTMFRVECVDHIYIDPEVYVFKVATDKYGRLYEVELK
ncbi:MAG: hypothetical protein GY849_11220 [Deltaproteobacteria bacterium]|nr:hypothetical protein [Deltaproteobacteria bacterium]